MSPASPSQTILELSTAYWSSRCLHVVAELGVADALDEAPRTAAELAAKTGTDAGALHRVLRLLAHRGIFELRDGRFVHNDVSRLLRTGVAGSLRCVARTFGLPLWWSAYGALEHSLKTGLPAAQSVTGQSAFSYLGQHPEEARLFGETMATLSGAQMAPLLEAYDFGNAKVIGDIGGGLGHLLEAVLGRSPQVQGVLFDRPEVIEEARKAQVPGITYVAGDFFRDPIPPCDMYLIKRVLHDWSDADAVAILRNIKAGAPRGARILLIEGVLSEDTLGPLSSLDVEMLVMTGGKERTREEWERLLVEAGVSPLRVVPAGPATSIIEAQVP